MSQEIERKFLIRHLPAPLDSMKGTPIAQGYLSIEPQGNQVRLRKKGVDAILTVKRGQGIVREEHEIALTPTQFEALWPLTTGRRLTKVRYETPYDGKIVEIDVYGGINEGLIVAEVEFETESAAEAFIPPEWLGKDVSNCPEYGNPYLARE